MNSKFLFLLASAAFLGGNTFAASNQWSLVDRIKVGGEGGWDYLVAQPETDRLFVSHSKQVVVLHMKDKSIIGTMVGNGIHGIALAPDLKKGFISNGADNSVAIFDLNTLKITKVLPVGKKPDAICYEPVTHKVFAFNGDSASASVIDTTEEKVIGEIKLEGGPEFAVADGKGFLFNALEDKGQVIKINATTSKVETRWTLPAESEPAGMAIDAVNQRLFVGCGNQTLVVLDYSSGKTIATLPIGKGIDACAYDVVGKRVFASCGDGTMTVIKQSDKDTYAVEEKVSTEPRARTMAFNPKTGTAYLPCAEFGVAPAATESNPRPRPPVVPDSFEILVYKTKA